MSFLQIQGNLYDTDKIKYAGYKVQEYLHDYAAKNGIENYSISYGSNGDINSSKAVLPYNKLNRYTSIVKLLPTRFQIWFLNGRAQTFVLYKSLKKHLLDRRDDVVVVHSNIDLFFKIASHHPERHCVLYLHNIGLGDTIKRYQKKYQLKNIFIIAVCKASIKDITDIPAYIVYNGTEPSEKQVEEYSLQQKNETTFFYAGRVDENKNVAYLVSMLKELNTLSASHGQKIKLICCTDNRAEIMSISKELGFEENVQTVGWISKEEMSDIFLNVDFPILVSKQEACSLFLLESFAYGHSPIASAVGGSTELINENGTNGLAIDISLTPKENAAEIYKYIQNEEQVNERRRSAYHSYISNFTLEKMGVNFIKVINELKTK